MSQSTQPRKAAPLRAARRFDEGNRRAAEIILRDPQRYEALVEWALRFRERIARSNEAPNDIVWETDQPRHSAA